jgi:hypothetical protein
MKHPAVGRQLTSQPQRARSGSILSLLLDSALVDRRASWPGRHSAGVPVRFRRAVSGRSRSSGTASAPELELAPHHTFGRLGGQGCARREQEAHADTRPARGEP